MYPNTGILLISTLPNGRNGCRNAFGSKAASSKEVWLATKMYGVVLSCEASYIFFGKTRTSGNQRSAHNIQIVKIAFPPRIRPRNEAIRTNGKRINMSVTNQAKAHTQ